MAEIIRFSDDDQKKTLSIPEARRFLLDGVINPDSEDWTKLTPEKQQEVLDECAKLTDATSLLCKNLKDELAKEVASSATKPDATKKTEKKSEIPVDIKTAADGARAQVRKTFGDIGSKDYNISMSKFREYVLQYIPGLDISGADDIADAMYQPRARIEQIIDALEQAGAESSDHINFPNKYMSNELLNKTFSAMGFSSISDNDLKDPDKKKNAILGILTQLTRKMEGRKASDWEATTLIGDAWWAGLIVGGSYLGLWKLPSMFTHAILSRIPFVGKHLAGVAELKKGEGTIYKTAKGTVELGKNVVGKAGVVVDKAKDINTLHTLGTITTASQRISDIQSKLPTSVAKARLDGLKALASEIDAMPKGISTIFSSAAKSNEINVRIIGVLKTIPDDFLILMQSHADIAVKEFASQLAKAVNFAKSETTALAGAKLLIEILKKVK